MMRIKEIINNSGMSQRKFAEAYGIPWRTISNWVRGINACPDYLTRLLEIAETERRLREQKNMHWWVVEDNGYDLEAKPLPYAFTRSDALAAAEQWFDKHYTRHEQMGLQSFYIALAPEFMGEDGPDGCIDYDREVESVDLLWTLQNWEQITELMDDGIREDLHAQGFDTKTEFFEAYQAEHLEKFGEEFTI